jgi:cytoskeletal protein CcmA (bactofilin family)
MVMADTEKTSGQIDIAGQTVNNIQADTVTVQYGYTGDIEATTALLSLSAAGDVTAEIAELRLAAAQNVQGQQVTVRQGLVLQGRAEQLRMTQSALAFAETQAASLHTSSVGAVMSSGEVKLDQSFSRVVITRGDVTMDQSGGGVVVARNVIASHNTSTILLLTGRVNGNVNAVFGPAASAAFGAALALGLALLWWLKRRLT